MESDRSLELEASAGAWAYATGDRVRFVLRLRHLASSSAAASAQDLWVDWLSVQMCGYLYRKGATAAGAATAPNPAAPRGGGTSLPDEARTESADDRICFLASKPTVVTAGLCLSHSESTAFSVVAVPAGGLPAAFVGEHTRIEYALVVSLRMMSPPSRERSGWAGLLSGWRRGGISSLRLPLLLLNCQAPDDAPPKVELGKLTEPLQCPIESSEIHEPQHLAEPAVAGVTMAGVTAADDFADEQSEEDDDDDCGDDHGGDYGGDGGGLARGAAWGRVSSGAVGGGGPLVPPNSFEVRLGDAPFASVELRSAEVSPGAFLSGTVGFAWVGGEGAGSSRCERMTLSLVLEEETRTHGTCNHIAATASFETSSLVHSSFSLPLPQHWPVGTRTPQLTLGWALLFRFELDRDDDARRLDWRLPLTVRPAARMDACCAPFVAPPRRKLLVSCE